MPLVDRGGQEKTPTLYFPSGTTKFEDTDKDTFCLHSTGLLTSMRIVHHLSLQDVLAGDPIDTLAALIGRDVICQANQALSISLAAFKYVPQVGKGRARAPSRAAVHTVGR